MLKKESSSLLLSFFFAGVGFSVFFRFLMTIEFDDKAFLRSGFITSMIKN